MAEVNPTLVAGSDQNLNSFFVQLRNSLDEHYDRRERIIKCSRDITALSKKMIFSLHRITQRPMHAVFKEAEERKKEIIKKFEEVSVELGGGNYYRYLRSISPAIQEYIEALAFWEYLKNDRLISKEEVEKTLVNSEGQQLLAITDEDYVLGVADLSGELMRYAINCVGKGDHDTTLKIRHFLREMKGEYDLITVTARSGLGKKLDAMKASLNKVEDACYSIRIRGSEYPKEMFLFVVNQLNARNEEREEEGGGLLVAASHLALM
ncbi:uncharacterized protein VTP21DRAFT_1250 [Calcarisporiella thermophila]|uniref:uncharacterized protein n=1 Tax=Calcarisporiella thermophila TaxID=911321 RepID=UPI003744A967